MKMLGSNKKSRLGIRIGVWVFVVLGGSIAFWQWSTLRAFRQAENYLSEEIQKADAGQRETLHLSDVEGVFDSTKTVGPISQGRTKW